MPRQGAWAAILPALLLAAACATGSAEPDPQHLFLWEGGADDKSRDFLAVFDVTRGSPRVGELVATLSAPDGTGFAHHTEHEMPEGGVLAANDFGAGRSWLFDLRKPARPRVAATFAAAGGLTAPPPGGE